MTFKQILDQLTDNTILNFKWVERYEVRADLDEELLNMEVEDSGIAEELAILATDPALTSSGLSQQAREAGLLNGYSRGDYEFAEYVADVIEQNWRKFGWIEYDVKARNRSRSYLEMRANVRMTAQQYKKINPYNLVGWLVSYEAEDGPVVDEEFNEIGL